MVLRWIFMILGLILVVGLTVFELVIKNWAWFLIFLTFTLLFLVILFLAIWKPDMLTSMSQYYNSCHSCHCYH